MFEEITFEMLIQRMMDRIPNTLDKREGSVIYNAIAPVAAELAQMYINLSFFHDSKRITKAENDDLDEFGVMFAVDRRSATFAEISGTFMSSGGFLMSVPIGARYTLQSKFYTVISAISTGIYRLKAEEQGTASNLTGQLLPVDFIPDLGSATADSILIFGEDAETDEDYRTRLLKTINQRPQDGNVAQYIEWAEGFEGIGSARIKSTSAGFVDVYITNAVGQPPSQVLVDNFQEYLDPNSEGLGMGQAPIGAIVTVSGATPKTVDISLKVTGGAVDESALRVAIEKHFAEIAFNKDYVNYFQIVAVVTTNTNAEIQELLINDDTTDIPLVFEEVPILGVLEVLRI